MDRMEQREQKEQREQRRHIKSILQDFNIKSKFNAWDVKKVHELIKVADNKNNDQHVYSIKNDVTFIQNSFRLRPDSDHQYRQSVMEKLASDLGYGRLNKIEHELAKSVYLSECKINFVKSEASLNEVFFNRDNNLGITIKDLEKIQSLEHSAGFYKYLEKLIKSVKALKDSLLIKSRLNNDDILSSRSNEPPEDYITFEDLCRATGRINEKSFYALIKGGELKKSRHQKAVTLISARKWFAEKGFNQYKSVEHNIYSEGLLRLLLHGPD